MFKRILAPLEWFGLAFRASASSRRARLARASGGFITLVRVINTAPAWRFLLHQPGQILSRRSMHRINSWRVAI